MGWAYGLVEMKGKNGSELQVCEVYFEKKKPWAWAAVDWKQLREDRKHILEDIQDQTKGGFEFYFDGKKIRLKKRRKKNG